ncbi:hypothetical protein C8254_07685 [Sulfitobacter sp. CB-A]|nr:hypothetical protein C8254_07685 [Sulfitobacter sp. CB-A]
MRGRTCNRKASDLAVALSIVPANQHTRLREGKALIEPQRDIADILFRTERTRMVFKAVLLADL